MSLKHKDIVYNVEDFLDIDMPHDEKEEALIAYFKSDGWDSEYQSLKPIAEQNLAKLVIYFLTDRRYEDIWYDISCALISHSSLEAIQYVLQYDDSNLKSFIIQRAGSLFLNALERGDTGIITFVEKQLQQHIIKPNPLTWHKIYLLRILCGPNESTMAIFLRFIANGFQVQFAPEKGTKSILPRLCLADCAYLIKEYDSTHVVKTNPISDDEPSAQKATQHFSKFLRHLETLDDKCTFLEEFFKNMHQYEELCSANFELCLRGHKLQSEIFSSYLELYHVKLSLDTALLSRLCMCCCRAHDGHYLDRFLQYFRDKVNPGDLATNSPTSMAVLEWLCVDLMSGFPLNLRLLLTTYPETSVDDLPGIVLRISQGDKSTVRNSCDNLDVVYKHLEDSKALRDITQQDEATGNTALHFVILAWKGQTEQPVNDVVDTFLNGFGKHIDPNVRNKDGDNAILLASKIKDGPLLLLHKILFERYDPNLQDKEGNTVLMHAVLNYSPGDIKQLLSHSDVDVTIKNQYEQDVTDIIRDADKNVDPKTKKLVEVAFDKQTTKQTAKKRQTLECLVTQMRALIKESELAPQTQKTVEDNLDEFQNSFLNAMEGREPEAIGMSKLHRRKLQGKRLALLDDLDDNILDNLYQSDTIDTQRLEEIRSFQSRGQRMRALLDTLPRCGEKAYDSFIASLRATKKDYLADMLETYDPSAPASDDASRDESQALVPVSAIPSKSAAVDDPAMFCAQVMFKFTQLNK